MIRLSTICLLFASNAQAMCRGEIALGSGLKTPMAFEQPRLVEGGPMTLGHPITEDFDVRVSLTIQKLLKTPSGWRVYATYDRTNFTGFLSFEAKASAIGDLTLADFKGFEGPIPFGPAEIKCPRE